MDEKNEITLLFLPGAGGTASKWRRVRDLMNGYRCVFADLPGHGLDANPVLHSIKDYFAYFKPQITGQTIVIGHSMGGLIGIELAVNHPNVLALVLAASHYVLPVDSKLFDKLETGVYPDGLFYASYSKEVDPDLLEEERRELNHVSLETTIIDYRCCNEYRYGSDSLSHLRKPILAIYGEDDRMLLAAARDDLKALVPHASIEVVSKAGHYVMLEGTEHFVKALQRFVRQVSEKEVSR
ncbi:alpha/beta fold hydrolase [Ferviditalea candida]|uniref:Alpha/beta hydrolase n=1 Tax=Ferviditalea candida TaxID=3108399 RepID=A0ABU5ZN61_9BACL|nr:alpha/beta hydrolase [Paenibacillaceae bacterium T2]